MTKVLAINSSPKMDESNTALILNPFLEGMREAGAETELFYTKKLKINPCEGEWHCWLKTPGECFQKDDMQMLYPKLREADIWVFASPVYIDGITGPMKTLMDRIAPLVQPFIELIDGHCRHPLYEGVKHGRVVLVSNCGFWEMDNFDPMVVHIKAACKNWGREFAGAVLRPTGGRFRTKLENGEPVDDILEAAKRAGCQLVEDGEMSTETLNIVSRELLPLDEYVQSVNDKFQQAMDAAKEEG